MKKGGGGSKTGSLGTPMLTRLAEEKGPAKENKNVGRDVTGDLDGINQENILKRIFKVILVSP